MGRAFFDDDNSLYNMGVYSQYPPVMDTLLRSYAHNPLQIWSREVHTLEQNKLLCPGLDNLHPPRITYLGIRFLI